MVGVQVLIFVLSTVLDIDHNGKVACPSSFGSSRLSYLRWLILYRTIRASSIQMRISRFDEDTPECRERPPFRLPVACLA